MTDLALIAVVDDDESPGESLEGILKLLGHTVALFSSAEGFLGSQTLANANCLILDVRTPGMSGPELRGHRTQPPIVFITAHRDEQVIARVKADGAVDCLLKPFSENSLSNVIDLALPG